MRDEYSSAIEYDLLKRRQTLLKHGADSTTTSCSRSKSATIFSRDNLSPEPPAPAKISVALAAAGKVNTATAKPRRQASLESATFQHHPIT
jgi:predicted component of type VI protein secretion system